MTYAIQVENLTKYYGRPGTGALAVDHIGFEVQRGEVFGFLGPNGAGKTTTQRYYPWGAESVTTTYRFTGKREEQSRQDGLAAHFYVVVRRLAPLTA
jgi:ABC-type uncharacterized transport system ATPase subunit